MKKLLLAAVVSLSAATAFASDSAERQIYSDPNFEQNRV
ncbi:peptidase propeptide and YPEB domain protein, partial [Neisseria meningitidis]